MSCPLCKSAARAEIGANNGYTIVACEECGLRYVQDMPGADLLQAYYARQAIGRVPPARAARAVRAWWWQLLALRLLAPGRRFLDIACDIGCAVEAARRLGFEATGYEVSTPALKHARAAYGGADFRVGSAREALAAGQVYDAVLCAESIGHLDELDSLAHALTRLVRQGGVLLFSTPNADRHPDPADLLARPEFRPPGQLIYFGRQQLLRYLDHYGFKPLFFLPAWRGANLRVVARRL